MKTTKIQHLPQYNVRSPAYAYSNLKPDFTAKICVYILFVNFVCFFLDFTRSLSCWIFYKYSKTINNHVVSTAFTEDQRLAHKPERSNDWPFIVMTVNAD